MNGRYQLLDGTWSDAYSIGDRFVVKRHGTFTVGSVVELHASSHSRCPLFKLVDGTCFFNIVNNKPGAYCEWDKLALVERNPVGRLAMTRLETELADREAEITKYLIDRGWTPPPVPEPPKQWEPKGGMHYVSGWGSVELSGHGNEDFVKYGVQFTTKPDAEKAAAAYRRYHRLYKLAEELNDGWEPDWNNHSEPKFRINHSEFTGLRTVTIVYSLDNLVPVFKTRELAEEAIRLITECNALGDSE